MKTIKTITVIAAAALLMGAAEALADSTNATLTVNASVGNALRLELGGSSSASINFTVAVNSPDSIPASENPLSVSAKARVAPGSAVTLTCQANGDLSGTNGTIGIENVTWTVASGSGFQGGTMSKNAPVTVGSWTGPGQRNGSLNFYLANSWDYATGNYSAIVTYTLTAP